MKEQSTQNAMQEHIQRMVEVWPPPTKEQVDRVAHLLYVGKGKDEWDV